MKTWQLGIGINSGVGIGSSKSIGFALSKDSKTGKWHFGPYVSLALGAHVGAGIDGAFDFTFSDNECIEQLEGFAVTGGGGVGLPFLGPRIGVGAERNIPLTGNAKPSTTLSLTGGVGTPDVHAYGSYTRVWSWF